MQQLAFDLLVDDEVGIFRFVADEIVRKLPLPDIYRAVDQWLPDQKAGPGALKHRLDILEPSDKPSVALSAGFLVSELFQRHRLPDELLAGDDRRKYTEVSFPDDSARRKQYRT